MLLLYEIGISEAHWCDLCSVHGVPHSIVKENTITDCKMDSVHQWAVLLRRTADDHDVRVLVIASALQWIDIVHSLNAWVQRGVRAKSFHDIQPVAFLNRCQVPFQLKLFEKLTPRRRSFNFFAQL